MRCAGGRVIYSRRTSDGHRNYRVGGAADLIGAMSHHPSISAAAGAARG